MISAFLLGLLSSLHCVGMCGPLALALPLSGLSRVRRMLAGLAYHSGRILVYTLAGVVFGLFGRGVYLAGWQQEFSILLGTIIVLLALSDRFRPLRFPFFVSLQGTILRLWQLPGRAKFFFLGMVNGLLPCGMVYLAIAGALTRVQVYEAAGFMTFFGLGTLPLLLGLQYMGYRLGGVVRVGLRRAVPFVTIAVGVMLILRGLDLGIPFLSPVLAAAPGKVVSCH